MRKTLFLAAAAVALTACSPEITDNVKLNGKALAFKTCRSGAVFGYRGVELIGADGTRMSIAATESGKGSVMTFAAGSDTPVDFGPCGSFTVEDQSTERNRVTNVKGVAKLECKNGDSEISGSVTFANCH